MAARKRVVSPAKVAKSFVKQYYGLLRDKPEDLHRFYKVESRFTHGFGAESVETVTGKQAIHDKIESLNFRDVTVELESGASVDVQASQDGGVLVVVLGFMSVRGSPLRPFTQTFFLAPQQVGASRRGCRKLVHTGAGGVV